MTTVAVSPAPEPAADERRALWTVARYEALRLVRHPIFVVAALLFIYGTRLHAVQRVRRTRRTTPRRTVTSRTSTTPCRPRSCSDWAG